MKPPTSDVRLPKNAPQLYQPPPRGAVQDQPEFQTSLQRKMFLDKNAVPEPLSQLRYMGITYNPMEMVESCIRVNDIYTNPRFGSRPFNSTSVSARPIDPLSKLGFSRQRVEPLGGNLKQDRPLLRTNY